MHPLIPLLIVVIILLAAAAVGFVIYGVATDIASKTSKKMEESNINFGKDGMKIGMREIKQEDYVSRTQNVLVQAWNLSTWPAYKSRFWNRQQPGAAAATSTASGSKRPGMSPRTMSGTSSRSGSERVSSSHHSTSHRTENGRLAEPRPAYRRTASGSSIPGSFD